MDNIITLNSVSDGDLLEINVIDHNDHNCIYYAEKVGTTINTEGEECFEVYYISIDSTRKTKNQKDIYIYEEDFQVASFNLKNGEKILNHYHPKQERKIFSTSEMITLIEGKIKINIFDFEENLVHSEILTSGDSVALLRGGHGIEFIENSKFIESKQGPYVEKSDKVRF